VQVGAYDSANNLVQHRSFAYDNVNRLAVELGAQNQETDYSYDPQGNLTRVADPLSHQTSYAYDTLNRRVATTDAASGLTRFGYDALDRLTAEQDPKGLTTGYFYDGLDDQTGVASPDTGSTVKTYDAAGNVLTSTDARGFKTTYSYDALNRVTQAHYADGTASTYQYDQGQNGIGHLTRMLDPSGVTQWTYDTHGRVTSKVQDAGNVTLTTRLAYDAAGRLSQMQYPSGKTINVRYDADGQVNGLSLGNAWLVSNVAYRPFGPVQSWKEGNNATFSRVFDTDGRITGINMGGVANVTYAYDASGRITGETESGQPGQAFGYDALDRLTGFVSGTATTTYAYDADGNRLNLSTPVTATTETYTYAATSNRLLSLLKPTARDDNDKDHDKNHDKADQAQPLAFTYDATGNTLSDGTHVFTYDVRGRMSSVLTSKDVNDRKYDNDNREAHHATLYGINGLGERTVKQAANRDDHDWDDFMRGFGVGTIEYVYDASGHLIGEYDAKGRAIHETVYLGDLPVAVLDGTNCFGEGRTATNIHYVNPDNLGAPHVITDERNKKVWQWTHAPFGDTQPVEAAGFTYDLRFPGQIFDAESGLSNNLFRDYNPALGRYAQSDPIGLAGGVNTYGYVGQNPVWAIDPSGLTEVGPNEPCSGTEGATCPGSGGGSTPSNIGPAAGLPQGNPTEAGGQCPSNPFGIPGNYTARPADTPGGTIYQNRDNPHYSVRVMPANPTSEFPSQQVPYVIDRRAGSPVDINGNPVLKNSPEAHIPQDKYVYKP
jgi:RHS repeat-associated protein